MISGIVVFIIIEICNVFILFLRYLFRFGIELWKLNEVKKIGIVEINRVLLIGIVNKWFMVIFGNNSFNIKIKVKILVVKMMWFMVFILVVFIIIKLLNIIVKIMFVILVVVFVLIMVGNNLFKIELLFEI